MQKPTAAAEAAIGGPNSDLIQRVEICLADGTPWASGSYDDRLLDGSVTVDYSRDERRSFEVSLDNSDFALEHAPGKFWYDKVLKPFYGVRYVDSVPVITFKVRKNLSNNPRAAVNATGFGVIPGTGGTAGGVRITGAGAPESSTAYEVTWTGSASDQNGGAFFLIPVGGATITPGDPHSGKIYVQCSKTTSLQAIMSFWDDSGTLLGSTFRGALVPVTAGDWLELKVENVIAPAGTTRILVGASGPASGGSAWVSGDKVAITRVMIEKGATAGSNFTGATGGFANRTYAWDGTAEQSTSTETITVTNYVKEPTTWEIQLGEFLIDRITEDHFPYDVKVSGRDYTKKCIRSKYVITTAYASGTAIETAIKSIAQGAGITKFLLPVTGSALGKDYFFERGVTRWEAMNQIAGAFGYELFFDAQGYLVMREYLDPLTAPLGYTLLTGVFSNLVTYQKSLNDSRIYNHILVTGESSDGEVNPVWAEALNTEPSSPTRISEIGDRLYEYSSSFITTEAQAQDVADKFLRLHALEEFDLNFSSIALPWLDVGEIVQFLDPRPSAGQPDRFLLSSLTIPLGLGPMSGNAKRVTYVG